MVVRQQCAIAVAAVVQYIAEAWLWEVTGREGSSIVVGIVAAGIVEDGVGDIVDIAGIGDTVVVSIAAGYIVEGIVGVRIEIVVVGGIVDVVEGIVGEETGEIAVVIEGIAVARTVGVGIVAVGKTGDTAVVVEQTAVAAEPVVLVVGVDYTAMVQLGYRKEQLPLF